MSGVAGFWRKHAVCRVFQHGFFSGKSLGGVKCATSRRSASQVRDGRRHKYGNVTDTMR